MPNGQEDPRARKITLSGQECAELPRRRVVKRAKNSQKKYHVTKKVSNREEGVGHRVARRLLCRLLAAAKVTVSLNVGAGGPKYAFGLKLPLQSLLIAQ